MGTARIQSLIHEIAQGWPEGSRPPRMLDLLDSFVETRNLSATTIFPDEVDLLREICRRIDDEPDAVLAWTKVRDIERTEVFKQPSELIPLQQAVSFNLLQSTVAFVNLDDGKAASATLVAIGDRVFLATAGHVVPARPAGKISIVGNKATGIRSNILPVLSYGTHSDEHCDVAFVESTPDFIATTVGKAAIPLSRLHPCGTGQDNHWTFVCGYPSQEIIELGHPLNDSRTKLFTIECWGNKLLMPDRWGSLEIRDRPPSTEKDVFIPRPITDDFVSIGPWPTKSPSRLAEPYGMSGGGYWQPNLALRTEVWNPEYYSLIAIQSRWWGRGRYLQGTQIIHWLRLVWQRQSNVREILASAFPSSDLWVE